MKKTLATLALLTLCLSHQAHAVQPDEILDDQNLEQRARLISQDLRCLVCQNQSIDDSDADLAKDIRVLVRQRLKTGDTDQQVKDFLIKRYGDYVLLTPPFQNNTYLLWGGPLLFLLLGGWALYRQFNKSNTHRAKGPTT